MSTIQFEVRTGRASGYTQVGDWILLAPISDRAARIYGLLRMHCEGLHDDESWPSQLTLADMLRLKKADTIQAAIKELVEIGAVNVETIPTQHGRRNRYTVHLSPPPGYDRGPRDRASYYAGRQSRSRGVPRNQGSPVQGDTPKSGVMGHPRIRGDGSPLPGGSEGLQVEGLQEEEKIKPSASASAPTAPDAQPAGETFTEPACVEAGVRPTPQPSVPGQAEPAGAEISHPRDDLEGSVDLFGTNPPPATKGRARKPAAVGCGCEGSAQDVVKAWMDAFATTGVIPPAHRPAQVGAEAKRLLASGNRLEKLVEAATLAGRAGYWSLERELVAMARRANGNGRGPGGDTRGSGRQPYRNPGDQSMYEINPFHLAAEEQARQFGEVQP